MTGRRPPGFDEVEQLVRAMRAEVAQRGFTVPATWNTALVGAMLGSSTGALLVYSTLCQQGLHNVPDDAIVRDVARAAPRNRRREQVRQMRCMMGHVPVTSSMLRSWHQVARAEGNVNAGADMLIERVPFARPDGISGRYDQMDNGDNVVHLQCPCGATTSKRWRPADLVESGAAGPLRLMAAWHAECEAKEQGR